jgi:CubicO group peptidase (beta-lactamase class C family)
MAGSYPNGNEQMKKHLIGIFLILISALFPLTSPAQERTDSQGPTDPAELEAFIDGIMAVQLQANHVAGATIAVVKDGNLFFAKGYGFADLKNKKPVLADRTMFRPGSVSKLFTWTAVMQLYEQGKIDLDADVNTYLKDFKIPATYPQPITMTHLLSHTPGFEDLGMGMWARTAKDLSPLGPWLAAHIPARVRPPGELTSYSNYGTALAGYIVEVVSGIPFEDYIEQNIFKPLGMEHSTFREPLPAAIAPDMSVAYTFKDGLFKAEDFELINGMNPAGSSSACATDMAKFMIAHLQNGQFGDRRILKEETTKFMHTRLFAHDPRVAGNAHGFWEADVHGLHLIEHGGDTIYFHSQLALIPEKNLGWFVSYNSPNGPARGELFEAFLDRYYPPAAPAAEVKALPDSARRLRQVSGSYGITRRSFKTYEKLAALMMTIKMGPTKEGNLLVALPGAMGARQFVEIEPLVFQQLEGRGRIVFRADAKGRITHAFLDILPHTAMVKLAWYQTPPFHYLLLAFSVLLFLTAVLGWPLAALSRVLCRRKCTGAAAPKAARWLAGVMSGLFIASLLCAVSAVSNEKEMMAGVPPILKFGLALPLIAALLGAGALVYLLKAWRKGYWTRCHRLHYTLVFVAALVFLWFLNFWNLLGWRF